MQGGKVICSRSKNVPKFGYIILTKHSWICTIPLGYILLCNLYLQKHPLECHLHNQLPLVSAQQVQINTHSTIYPLSVIYLAESCRCSRGLLSSPIDSECKVLQQVVQELLVAVQYLAVALQGAAWSTKLAAFVRFN